MPESCREHHFEENHRCRICQIRYDYYTEAMATLSKWSLKDKMTNEYIIICDSFKCKPHTHTDLPSKNPLSSLEDIERVQY